MPLLSLVPFAASVLAAAFVVFPAAAQASPDEPADTMRAQPLRREDDTGV